MIKNDDRNIHQVVEYLKQLEAAASETERSVLVEELAKICRSSGYRVSGPYTEAQGRVAMIDSFKVFRENFDTYRDDDKRPSVIKHMVKMLQDNGFRVSGPFGVAGGRDPLVDSFRFFRDSFVAETANEARAGVIKQLVQIVRGHGYHVVNRRELTERRVRSLTLDATFEALYQATNTEGRSLLSKERLYVIWQALQNIPATSDPSVEVGLYRGGTSAFIVRALSALHHRCGVHFAVDPLSGHQVQEVQEFEVHRSGNFSDVSAAEVAKYLAQFSNVTLIEKTFADSISELPSGGYRFAHLDTDLYVPTLQALTYFAPRMVAGGVIVVDDYMAPKCVGVTRAVNEFLERDASLQVWSFGTEQVILSVPAASTCSKVS